MSEETRNEQERNGHRYTTDVDSEVIAHQYGEIPETLDEDFEEPDLSGSLNYILFTEDRILIRHTSKYRVTEDMRMSTATRRRIDLQDSVEVHGVHLFHADGTHESESLSSRRGRRITTRSTRSRKGSAPSRRAWGGAASWGWYGASSGEPAGDDSDDCATCGLTMDDFEDARRGELTLDHPADREWVVESREGHVVRYYCQIHDSRFINECNSCWHEDTTAWGMHDYDGHTATKHGRDDSTVEVEITED